jgi:hypothetical protein
MQSALLNEVLFAMEKYDWDNDKVVVLGPEDVKALMAEVAVKKKLNATQLQRYCTQMAQERSLSTIVENSMVDQMVKLFKQAYPQSEQQNGENMWEVPVAKSLVGMLGLNDEADEAEGSAKGSIEDKAEGSAKGSKDKAEGSADT